MIECPSLSSSRASSSTMQWCIGQCMAKCLVTQHSKQHMELEHAELLAQHTQALLELELHLAKHLKKPAKSKKSKQKKQGSKASHLKIMHSEDKSSACAPSQCWLYCPCQSGLAGRKPCGRRALQASDRCCCCCCCCCYCCPHRHETTWPPTQISQDVCIKHSHAILAVNTQHAGTHACMQILPSAPGCSPEHSCILSHHCHSQTVPTHS